MKIFISTYLISPKVLFMTMYGTGDVVPVSSGRSGRPCPLKFRCHFRVLTFFIFPFSILVRLFLVWCTKRKSCWRTTIQYQTSSFKNSNFISPIHSINQYIYIKNKIKLCIFIIILKKAYRKKYWLCKVKENLVLNITFLIIALLVFHAFRLHFIFTFCSCF